MSTGTNEWKDTQSKNAGKTNIVGEVSEIPEVKTHNKNSLKRESCIRRLNWSLIYQLSFFSFSIVLYFLMCKEKVENLKEGNPYWESSLNKKWSKDQNVGARGNGGTTRSKSDNITVNYLLIINSLL